MSPRTRKPAPGSDAGSTATLDPVAIADKVAKLETDRRLEETVADVERWREIVASVAQGHEPSGEMLRDIGDIGRRLRLATDALAIDVRAYQEERRLSDQVASSRAEMERTRARRDEIFPEIKRLESELLKLRQELHTYHGLSDGLPSLYGARNEQRTRHPLLFADVAKVATWLVEKQTGAGMGRISPATSSATWE